MDIVERVTPPVSPGDRVVIRQRLPDGSATDVIGFIIDLTAQRIAVEDRRGVVQTIGRERVVIIKRVPATPRGRNPGWADAEVLERDAAAGWVDQVQPLGEWLLQAGGGYTNRANSCLAVGSPGCEPAAAVERILDFSAQNQIPPKARVIRDSEPEAALRSLGWSDGPGGAQVLVMRLSDLLVDRSADQRVELLTELSDRWLAAFRAAHPRTQIAPQAAARILAGPPAQCVFASLAGPDGIIALGRAHLAGEWASLTGLWTHPAVRRQGNMTPIVVALATRASRRGARNIQVQVAAGNNEALAAYQHLGFKPHHDYGYLLPPG